MNIERLRYFISVADLSSFTKAANEHFIAQTAISRHIAALEQELGVLLFYRNNRSVALTPAGEILLDDARKIIQIYDSALEKMNAAASENNRVLRVGFGDYERSLVTQTLKRFRVHYPMVRVELFQYSYQDLVYLLMSGRLDIVFSTKQCLRDASGVDIKEIWPNESVLVASASNPICSRERITKEDVKRLVFVVQAEEKGPYPPEEFRDRFRLEFDVLPKDMVFVNSLGTKLAQVESSDHVALIPWLVAESLSDDFHIMEMIPGKTAHSPFCVSNLSSNLNPDIRRFIKLTTA